MVLWCEWCCGVSVVGGVVVRVVFHISMSLMKIGSYFGHSVAAVDFNGDGYVPIIDTCILCGRIHTIISSNQGMMRWWWVLHSISTTQHLQTLEHSMCSTM